MLHHINLYTFIMQSASRLFHSFPKDRHTNINIMEIDKTFMTKYSRFVSIGFQFFHFETGEKYTKKIFKFNVESEINYLLLFFQVTIYRRIYFHSIQS